MATKKGIAKLVLDDDKRIAIAIMEEIEIKNQKLIEKELVGVKERLSELEKKASEDIGIDSLQGKLAQLEEVEKRILEIIQRVSDLELFEEEIRNNLGMFKLKNKDVE